MLGNYDFEHDCNTIYKSGLHELSVKQDFKVYHLHYIFYFIPRMKRVNG